MAIPLQKHESFTQEGAGQGTATYTIVNSGLYRVFLSTTCPAGSGTTLSCNQSGSVSNSLLTPALSSAQTHVEANALFTCVAGDVLTFLTVTSEPTNSVKSLYNVIQTNSGI